MIFDGNHGLVMCMRSPLFDRVVPTGKWVKMDVAKLGEEAGWTSGTLMNAKQADPSQSLRMLMASSGARVTGAERIRGVETTHYAFNIDFKKLAHDNKAFRQLTEKTGSILGSGGGMGRQAGSRPPPQRDDDDGRRTRHADDDVDHRGHSTTSASAPDRPAARQPGRRPLLASRPELLSSPAASFSPRAAGRSTVRAPA